MRKNNTHNISEGMLKVLLLSLFTVLLSTSASAQWMMINQGGGAPDGSAALEVSSTTRGFLGPRLTQTQINAVTSPASGLLVFNTDSNKFYFYDGSTWLSVSQTDTLSVLQDADGDTRIELEQNSDDDTMRVFTAGTQRLTISPEGNMGLGVSNSGADFHIRDTSAVMVIESTNDPTWARIHLATPNSNYLVISGLQEHKFGIRDFRRGTTDFVIDTFGHVGIGTMNPDYQLQVESSGFVNTNLQGTSGSGTWLNIGNSSAGGIDYKLISSGNTNAEGAGKLLFGVGTNPNGVTDVPMVLDSLRLGLGTANPKSQLHLTKKLSFTSQNGTGRSQIWNYNVINQSFLALRADSTILYGTGINLYGPNDINHPNQIRFYTTKNLNPDFLVDSSGNVAIGSDTALGNLQVGDYINVESGGGSQIYASNLYYDSDSADFRYMNNGSGGALSFNSSTNGNMGLYFFNGSATNQYDTIPANAPTSQLRLDRQGLVIEGSNTVQDAEIRMKAIIDTLNINNQFTLPAADGIAGQALITDGLGTVNWAFPDTLSTISDADGDTYIDVESTADSDDIQFYTNGARRMWLFNNGSMSFGSGSQASTYFAEFETPPNTNYPIALSVDQEYTGAAQTFGVVSDISNTGTGLKYGLYSLVRGNAAQSNSIYGLHNQITGGNTEDIFGVLNTMTGGSGLKVGVDNVITGNASQTGRLQGIRTNITPAAAEQAEGMRNTISAAGTGTKYGVINDVTGSSTQTQPIYGVTNTIASGNNETTVGVNNSISGGGSGQKYGVLNSVSGGTGVRYAVRNTIDIDGTSTGYGVYNSNVGSTGSGTAVGNYTLYNSGTGIKYGTFNNLTQASGANFVAGSQNTVTHNGTGLAYGVRATLSGTSTSKYGFYSSGENYNYFEGNVGIGNITNPGSALHIQNTGNPELRVESTSAGIPQLVLENSANTWQIRNFGGELRVFDGTTNWLTIETSGEVGIGTANPAAELDVVGDVQVPAANDYTYATAKTHYQSFAPTTFNSLLPDLYDFGTNAAANWYTYFRSGGTAFGYATVEVNLPDGASVTELRGWVYDNLNTNPVRVTLYRQQLGTATIAAMAEIESASATATTAIQNLSDNTVLNQVVDNTNYSYFLMFTGRQNSTDSRLYGARITYTVTEAD